MSIYWQYLDKKNATEKALGDYTSMKHILEHTDEKLKDCKEKMYSIGGLQLNAVRGAHNQRSTESRIIDAIDKTDVLKERYRQASEYMAWFEPAWDSLSEDERYTLNVFYNKNDFGSNAVYDVCEHFNIERSSAYNKKNRALEHLTTLLYGKA